MHKQHGNKWGEVREVRVQDNVHSCLQYDLARRTRHGTLLYEHKNYELLYLTTIVALACIVGDWLVFYGAST